jgi:SAM-dependent methyltransferase
MSESADARDDRSKMYQSIGLALLCSLALCLAVTASTARGGAVSAVLHPFAVADASRSKILIPHIPSGLFLDQRTRKGWPDYGPQHAGKQGLEIGGPSDTLRWMNIYDAAASLDNVNFAAKTIFTDNVFADSSEFKDTSGNVRGRQYIREAADLKFGAASYDFVISSHALEHSANPLACLVEWARVLKPNGTLLMLLPWGPGTFDRNRKVVTMAHLIADFEAKVGEDDLTHVDEIVRDHDFGTGLGPKTKEEFEARSRANPINRGMHQHVFDLGTLVQMATWAGFAVIDSELFQDINMLIYAVRI